MRRALLVSGLSPRTARILTSEVQPFAQRKSSMASARLRTPLLRQMTVPFPEPSTRTYFPATRFILITIRFPPLELQDARPVIALTGLLGGSFWLLLVAAPEEGDPDKLELVVGMLSTASAAVEVLDRQEGIGSSS